MERAVFRIPLTALVGIVVLAVGTTPLAFAAPGLQALYLLPVGLAVWVLRERTTVDASAVHARYLWSSRRLPWSELDGLMIGRSGAVRAVTGSGEMVRLPGVRFTDLHRIEQVSGGAVDVTGNRDPAAE